MIFVFCAVLSLRSYLTRQSSFLQRLLYDLEQFVFAHLALSAVAHGIRPHAGLLQALPSLTGVDVVSCVDRQQVAEGQGGVLFITDTGTLVQAFLQEAG